MRLFFATALVALALLESAAARTVFPVYGGRGDRENTDECPAGSYMVGVVGNVGNWVDQITVVCGQHRPDGSISGGKSLPSRGGSGGAFRSTLCGKDEVISGILMRRTPEYRIRFVNIGCRNVKTGATTGKSFAGSGGGDAGDGANHGCKSGELATGLVIRHGKDVNGVGLICGAFRPVAAAPPPPPPPPPVVNKPPPPPPPPPVVTTPPPPAVVTKTVVAEVTMYDKPANGADVCYLDPNDKVTVLTGADIPAAFRGVPDKRWVAVRGTSGDCNGKRGGVYNDGKLR